MNPALVGSCLDLAPVCAGDALDTLTMPVCRSVAVRPPVFEQETEDEVTEQLTWVPFMTTLPPGRRVGASAAAATPTATTAMSQQAIAITALHMWMTFS
jgi:hypothetical protein